MTGLAVLEEIIDASGAAPRIEAMLPIGVRPRQLSVPTLLTGMCLVQADGRPAAPDPGAPGAAGADRGRAAAAGRDRGLEARPARADLPADRAHFRPGHRGPRQGPARRAALPGAAGGLRRPATTCSKPVSRTSSRTPAPRWPWTGRTWSPSPGPPPAKGGDCADPEASRGHRKNNLLRSQDELFFGYYLPAGIMMPDENSPAIPELARRATASSCRHDPVRVLVPVLTAMPAAGIPLGDVLADSGYAHRDADARALPLRAAGAQLVQDSCRRRSAGWARPASHAVEASPERLRHHLRRPVPGRRRPTNQDRRKLRS